MAIVAPRKPDKTRLFSQEVQIADRNQRDIKEIAYIFGDNNRKFEDKVSKSGY